MAAPASGFSAARRVRTALDAFSEHFEAACTGAAGERGFELIDDRKGLHALARRHIIETPTTMPGGTVNKDLRGAVAERVRTVRAKE
jgi:hypothetical protein